MDKIKKIFTIIIISLITVNLINTSNGLQIDKLKIKNDTNKSTSISCYDNIYAVIIVGTYGSRYQKFITGQTREDYYYSYTGCTQAMFDILTKNYSIEKNNIFILLTEVNEEGYVPREDFNPKGFQNYYNSTIENISMVFNNFKPGGELELKKDDLLIVELIGHGQDDHTHKIPIIKKYIDLKKGINAHDTFFPLEYISTKKKSNIDCFSLFWKIFFCKEFDNNKKIYDHQLAEMVNEINAGRIIFFLQQCFSGGFINDLSKEKHVIITSAKEGEIAKDFLGPFHRGLGYNALWGKELADANKDGKLTLGETFNFTLSNITDNSFHPLIDDNGDGIGSEIINYSNKNDGFIASCIYEFQYEKFN